MSVAITKGIKTRKNNQSIESVLGYTINDLINHLEKQFDQFMNWDNHGSYWEIDHIIPVDAFNYDSFDHPQFKQCWSLNNLQPLYWLSNRIKNNTIIQDDDIV